jgi:hypothetical protein
MIRTLSAPFRITGKVNLSELQPVAPIGGGGTGWSPGAMLVDAIAVQPQAREHWTLLSYSVTGLLGIDLKPNNVTQGYIPHGKLGKILTSLVMGTDYIGATQGTLGSAISLTIPALPSDTTMMASLWDPQSDPLPMQSPYGTSVTPLAVNVQLPISRLLIPTEQFGIGIYMLPSLLGMGVVNWPVRYLWQCTYALIYDDEQRFT